MLYRPFTFPDRDTSSHNPTTGTNTITNKNDDLLLQQVVVDSNISFNSSYSKEYPTSQMLPQGQGKSVRFALTVNKHSNTYQEYQYQDTYTSNNYDSSHAGITEEASSVGIHNTVQSIDTDVLPGAVLCSELQNQYHTEDTYHQSMIPDSPPPLSPPQAQVMTQESRPVPGAPVKKKRRGQSQTLVNTLSIDSTNTSSSTASSGDTLSLSDLPFPRPSVLHHNIRIWRQHHANLAAPFVQRQSKTKKHISSYISHAPTLLLDTSLDIILIVTGRPPSSSSLPPATNRYDKIHSWVESMTPSSMDIQCDSDISTYSISLPNCE